MCITDNPNKGGNILAKSLAILWGADPVPEIMGLKRMSGLWVLGRP